MRSWPHRSLKLSRPIDAIPLLFHLNFQSWQMRSLPTLDPLVFFGISNKVNFCTPFPSSYLIENQSIDRHDESKTFLHMVVVLETCLYWRQSSEYHPMWESKWWPNDLENNVQNSCGSLPPSLPKWLFPMLPWGRGLCHVCRSLYSARIPNPESYRSCWMKYLCNN